MAGVKQGGILSLVTCHCVYVDDLICKISAEGIGCTIGMLFAGILIYADDIALLAPSLTALQKMLDICTQYGNTFMTLYNFCM